MRLLLLFTLSLLALGLPSRVGAQVMLPDDQLAPPILEPSDSSERWYGNGPADNKRIRMQVRLNVGEDAIPGLTYQHAQNFGNRTMQVVPILIIVDALTAKPGDPMPELDFRALASGNLSDAKQEGAIFKVARSEAMLPGEPVVTIPGGAEEVTVDWGEKRYSARRWRIVVNVQCQVRPRDGKPLAKPQPFAFQFSYSTSLRSENGPREWRTAWSPPFAVTTSWTADSGPMVSLPAARDFDRPPSLLLAGALLFLTVVILFMSFGDLVIRRLRHRNYYHALDPEEEFWKVVSPLFAACKVADGYALPIGAVYDVVIALKRFADAKGAGTSVGFRLSTSTADKLEGEKHNIVCGDELSRIINQLEVLVIREGRELKPGAAKDVFLSLQRLVGGFPY